MASPGTASRFAPNDRIHLSQVDQECGWARTHLLVRAILNNPDLLNPLPNLPTGDILPEFLRLTLLKLELAKGFEPPTL